MNEKVKHKKKKKLGHYPSVSVVFGNTIAIFVIGLFGILVLHTNELSSVIRQNVEVQVFLNKNVQENERIKLSQTLAAQPFTAVENDKPQIVLITKEEAAQNLVEQTEEDFMNLLNDNPLLDVLSVKINPNYQSVDSMKVLKAEIEAYTGVFEALYAENEVQAIQRNITKISLILIGFAVILLFTVVILINNTIKLALFSQRFLIRSMQLVGAKASFIKRPFLQRAMGHGIIAALLAAAFLYGITQVAYSYIEDLQSLQNIEQQLILFGVLLIIGALVAILSTLRAINKYLKLSLDELY